MLEVQVEDRDATTTPLSHLLMRGALRASGLVIHHKLTTATQGGGGQESDLGSVCPSPCIVPQRVGSHLPLSLEQQACYCTPCLVQIQKIVSILINNSNGYFLVLTLPGTILLISPVMSHLIHPTIPFLKEKMRPELGQVDSLDQGDTVGSGRREAHLQLTPST